MLTEQKTLSKIEILSAERPAAATLQAQKRQLPLAGCQAKQPLPLQAIDHQALQSSFLLKQSALSLP